MERLLADPKTLAAAARLLLDLHFTPVLAELICAEVDLDVPALDLAATRGAAPAARPWSRPTWAMVSESSPAVAATPASSLANNLNPDGSKALVTYNNSSAAIRFAIQSGTGYITYTIPPQAMTTFVWH